MRLINTEDLTFSEFFETGKIPEYGILSHRWTAEEVTYKEFRKDHSAIKGRAGYTKIIKFCEICRERGLQWAWVDTVCIDKRSSAELSEAINSMYSWYGAAVMCIVYLHDYERNTRGKLSAAAWFHRGWTLQELLAPSIVEFLDRSWRVVGHKCSLLDSCRDAIIDSASTSSSRSKSSIPDLHRGAIMNNHLSDITHIPERILDSSVDINAESVAARMSWASERNTTRVEDMAYCLLGIFDVHMPLLYGEGAKAFSRLQEQIVMDSNDDSIFAWETINKDTEMRVWGMPQSLNLLARSPSQFARCADIQFARCADIEPWFRTESRQQTFDLTTKWLEIAAKLEYYPSSIDPGSKLFFLPLRCWHSTKALHIGLTSLGQDSYRRADRNEFLEIAKAFDGSFQESLGSIFDLTSFMRQRLDEKRVFIELRPYQKDWSDFMSDVWEDDTECKLEDDLERGLKDDT